MKVAHIFILKHLYFCDSGNHKRHRENFLTIVDPSPELFFYLQLPCVPKWLILHNIRECNIMKKIKYTKQGSQMNIR